MERLKMQTSNIADENFQKLAALFPNAVTEIEDENGEIIRAIDADVLRREIFAPVVEGSRERYQFTWPDKNKTIHQAGQEINKTLRLEREKSVGKDGTPGSIDTENIYIEGDNLDALKILREAYLGKVKMIYIDPPYNTGHDFVYDDDFSQTQEEYYRNSGQFNFDSPDEKGGRLVQNLESNGRFHTDWLNMIYPRLKIARDFLSDDGVIFISIDDNEQANLKKICDEIFGAGNFVFQISWRRTDNQPNIGKLARVKEYILCFSKNIYSIVLGKLPLTDKAKAEYRYKDNKGLFRRAILLDKTRGRYHYPITTKSGNKLTGPWMKTKEEFEEMERKSEIYWTSGGDEQPYGKIYLSESNGANPNDFWGIEYGTNQRASLEVEKLFGSRCFDFPKPLSLIKTLLTLGTQQNDIIFDFFSGSATTAHAVMKLNAEDEGKRKFILVQIPEKTPENSEARKAGYKTICEIGEERIRRAAAKIREEYPIAAENLDLGFRVFRVDSSNMKEVFYHPDEFQQDQLEFLADNIKEDRTPEDLLFQVLPEFDIPLSAEIKEEIINGKKVFTVENGYLIACFDSDITEETVKAIALRKPYYAVFRDSGMSGDSVITNFEQIFETYSPETTRKIL